MWRPFILNLASHSYENFIKKVGRADSAPLKSRQDQDRPTSCEILSEEAKQRIIDFNNLRKKVKQQRETMKQQDLIKLRQKEIRSKIEKEKQRRARMMKMEENRRTRAYSSCKPTRVYQTKGVFGLTCVDNCRKLKGDDIMKEMKKINRSYMDKIQINWKGNKENLYRDRKKL